MSTGRRRAAGRNDRLLESVATSIGMANWSRDSRTRRGVPAADIQTRTLGKGRAVHAFRAEPPTWSSASAAVRFEAPADGHSRIGRDPVRGSRICRSVATLNRTSGAKDLRAQRHLPALRAGWSSDDARELPPALTNACRCLPIHTAISARSPPYLCQPPDRDRRSRSGSDATGRSPRSSRSDTSPCLEISLAGRPCALPRRRFFHSEAGSIVTSNVRSRPGNEIDSIPP